jgi:hypothetical protein
MEFTVEWVLSHTPFVLGSYEVVKARFTPISLHNSFSSSFLNSKPLSVKISPAPKRKNTSFHIAEATANAVFSLNGTKTMYFVKVQIAVKM